MAYPIENIIPVTVNISAAGLNTANFASAMLFAPSAELPTDFTADTTRSYSSLASLAADFASTTATYAAASRWFSSTPAVTSITVYGKNSADADVTTTLTKAWDSNWWYWTFFTADVLAVEADVLAIAAWQESVNIGFFANSQTGDSASAIRAATDGNICEQLTTLGYRHTFTASHATDPYAAFALCKQFAVVNWAGKNTAITGNFKKSPGIAAEDLSDTATTNMQKDTIKCAFYTVLSLDGSTDSGRWLNTWSHSANGETIADVNGIDAFVNYARVAMYNALAGATTKLPQTPVGQAVLLGAVRTTGAQFIANGFLGPRDYTSPDTGESTYTTGFELLTVATDILDLTDAERANHESYPISTRIFRAGEIWIADLTVNVY